MGATEDGSNRALFPTAAHFLVVICYRRKKNLVDPNPTSTLHNILRLGKPGEGSTRWRRVVAEKTVDAVLIVMIVPVDFYTSLVTSLVSSNGRNERRVNFACQVVFNLEAVGFLFLRFLALLYPVTSLLQGIVLVSLVSFPCIYLRSGGHVPGGAD